jgi:hypothetical protein
MRTKHELARALFLTQHAGFIKDLAKNTEGLNYDDRESYLDDLFDAWEGIEESYGFVGLIARILKDDKVGASEKEMEKILKESHNAANPRVGKEKAVLKASLLLTAKYEPPNEGKWRYNVLRWFLQDKTSEQIATLAVAKNPLEIK